MFHCDVKHSDILWGSSHVRCYLFQISLIGKYLKNLGQGKKSLKHSRKQDFISIKDYIKRLYNALKLIAMKQQAFFDGNLSENVGKPKELWKTLKSLAMPKKR